MHAGRQGLYHAYENKARYTANTSRGRVDTGGNTGFAFFNSITTDVIVTYHTYVTYHNSNCCMLVLSRIRSRPV